MGHLNRPNHNEEDNINHELTLEGEEIEEGEIEFEGIDGDIQNQHDNENDGARRYIPINECVWRQWTPPPQEPLFLALPSNYDVLIIRPIDAAHLQPLSQPPFPNRSVQRPPPISVQIPITHWSQNIFQQVILTSVIRRTLYSCRRVLSGDVQNRQFSDRYIQNIPPPRMREWESGHLQVCRELHRFPRSPSTTPPRSIYHGNSANANGLYSHRFAAKPRPSAMKVARRPLSHLMRRKSRRPYNRRRKMNVDEIPLENPQYVENNDEEEENDNDVEGVRRCEAYRDLHFDNDSDDDDNYGSNYALSNM